jgi:dTDP-4-amino-4,6-dideoxy-D-glucose acyltransferase
MGWLNEAQLSELHFLSLGQNVRISDRCSLYGTPRMRIGSNVRIDDFTIISAEQEVCIGSYVHISAQAFISGKNGCQIGDFSGISIGCCVLTASDDFSGDGLPSPVVPPSYQKVNGGPVQIGSHVIVGAKSVVLPNLCIPDGVTIGCLSLVKKSLQPWTVYAGIPVRPLKDRPRSALVRAAQLREAEQRKAS